jgi:hypothetical protein
MLQRCDGLEHKRLRSAVDWKQVLSTNASVTPLKPLGVLAVLGIPFECIYVLGPRRLPPNLESCGQCRATSHRIWIRYPSRFAFGRLAWPLVAQLRNRSGR